jgi:hypothetical protein
MNAALGFDTFLVMRHGARVKDGEDSSKRLGCYYCNDIVAPADVSVFFCKIEPETNTSQSHLQIGHWTRCVRSLGLG